MKAIVCFARVKFSQAILNLRQKSKKMGDLKQVNLCATLEICGTEKVLFIILALHRFQLL
jgi:hypothetical protein